MDENTTTPYQASYPEPQQPKKSKTGKIILLIVLVLVLIGGGIAAGWYVGKMDKDKAVENAKQEAAQNAAKKEETKPAENTTPQAKTTQETTCNADELSLSLKDSGESGAGTLAYDLVFKNISQRTCILGGFPGVSLVNANGNMVGSPAERAKNYEEKKLTLAPGQEVKSVVSTENAANFDNGECKEGALRLRVYPPNDTGYISIASTPISSWCPGFVVSPVLSM